MAYGDFAMFMPDEGSYRQPWAYDTAMRAEALKRSSYLSSMDQFYAQLGESKRQFDTGHLLETRKVDISEALGKAELALNEKLGMRKLDVEEKLGSRQLGLESQKLSDARSQNAWAQEQFMSTYANKKGINDDTWDWKSSGASSYSAPADTTKSSSWLNSLEPSRSSEVSSSYNLNPTTSDPIWSDSSRGFRRYSTTTPTSDLYGGEDIY